MPLTSVTLVDRPMIAGLAANVAASSNSLGDSVVTILTGADDYLAGQPLEVVLDQLDLLLEQLSSLPAMAVVGSIPNVLSALADLWLLPTSRLDHSRNLESGDCRPCERIFGGVRRLGTSRLSSIETSAGRDQWVSACRQIWILLYCVTWTQACGRAADKVRLFRTILDSMGRFEPVLRRSSPQPGDAMDEHNLSFLKRLLDAPGPSGYEQAPAKVWRAEADTSLMRSGATSSATRSPASRPKALLGS